MTPDPACHQHLLSLLPLAKEAPHDDGPRLVLADWLEDQGDHPRAKFVRLQCLMASKPSHEVTDRRDRLFNRHGGAWLGSLWRWWLSALRWHRGLLSVRLPRHVEPDAVADVLPWIDTALLQVTRRQSLRRAAVLLDRSGPNHAHFDVRMPMLEGTLLEELSLLPESARLRSLTFDWPLRMLRHRRCSGSGQTPHPEPAVSERFLARLLRECPLGRHLTHLGSSAPFSTKQAGLVADLGVKPVHALHPLWMHAFSPACFARRR
jgi:uncharacterized protein (TIGR02996 family)